MKIEIIQFLGKKHVYGSELRLAEDKGEWLLGYQIDGSACAPLRKWGVYKSRTEAIQHFVEKFKPRILSRLNDAGRMYNYTKPEINEIVKNMDELIISCNQLQLF